MDIGDTKARANDVRLAMFFHGNSVQIKCRCSLCNEERSPLNNSDARTGLSSSPHQRLPPIDISWRRVAGRDRQAVMSCRFDGIPWMDRDLSRPTMASIPIWKKGSQGDRSPSLYSDKLIGEDFERSR